MKQSLGASERLYPMPTPIVVSGTVDKPVGFTAAWLNVVSGTPATLAIGIRHSRNTLASILETGEFTVNLPSTKYAAEVDYFGTTSGRDHDKFAATGLTPEVSFIVKAPAIAEFPFHLECRVNEVNSIGSYEVIFAAIIETCADESVLDETGEVDIEKVDPLMYIAGMREYRAIGKRVAKAYEIGKSIG